MSQKDHAILYLIRLNVKYTVDIFFSLILSLSLYKSCIYLWLRLWHYEQKKDEMPFTLFSLFLIYEYTAFIFLYTLVVIIPQVVFLLVVKKERKWILTNENWYTLAFVWLRKKTQMSGSDQRQKKKLNLKPILFLLFKAIRYVDSNNQSSWRLSSLYTQSNWIDKSLFVLSKSNWICFFFIIYIADMETYVYI